MVSKQIVLPDPKPGVPKEIISFVRGEQILCEITQEEREARRVRRKNSAESKCLQKVKK